MNRNLSLFFGLLVLAGVVLLTWLAGTRDAESPVAPPAQHAVAPARAESDAALTPDPADVAPIARSVAAQPANEDGSASAAPSPTLRVRVLDGPGGPPAAGAEVLLPPLGGTAGVPETQRPAYQQANRDDQLDRWGRVFACDAEGIARVPQPAEERFSVGARRAGVWGRRDVRAAQLTDDAEVVIELARAVHVEVLVVDERRTPVGGIPVAYRALSRGTGHSLAKTVTGADGRARLAHLQEEIKRAGSGQQHVVAIGLPLEPTVQTDFDPGAPPDEPLLLVLPATGTVEVEVLDPSGAPYPDGLQIALQKQMPPEQRARYSQQGMIHQEYLGMRWVEVRDGIARFERVGLGLTLECGADFERTMEMQSITAPGPGRAGETVRLTLQQNQRHAAFTGRLIGADGAAIARQSVHWVTYGAATTRRVTYGGIRTGEDGSFRVPCSTAAIEQNVGLLVFTLPQIGTQIALACATLPHPLPTSDHDLGVIAAGTPVFVAGRALAPDGSPALGAHGSVEAVAPPPDGTAAFLDDLQWSTDDDARFVIAGALPAGRYRLRASVSKRPEWELPPVEFEAGAENLELRFTTATSVRGRLVADPGIELADFVVSLEFARASGGRSVSGSHSRADGSFEFQPQEEGSAALTVATPSGEPLLQRDDLIVTAGVVLDLGDLDLRGRLQRTQLALIGAHGEAIHEASLWSAPIQRLPQWLTAETSRFPRALITAPGARLLISAEGYGVTEVLLQGGAQTAALRPASKLQISCAGLPAERVWALDLEHAPAAGEKRFSPPGSPWICDATAGTLELSLPAPGTWIVHLRLQVMMDWNGRKLEGWERVQAAWGGAPATVVVPADGTPAFLTLTADPAALKAAMEAEQ
jgi:hypothetical protein